jgi:hypothetical protein
VEQLYDLLTAVGLNVWLDSKCLKPGVPWEQGFMEGLIKSYTFVCVLSADGFVSAEDSRCNYMTLREDSACDSCLLEQQLALELRAMGMLEYIYPVFQGQPSIEDPTFFSKFNFGLFSNLPNVSVDSVAEKLSMHLDNQALGSPFVPRRTVKETISDLFANQGGFIERDFDTAMEDIAHKIAGICFEEEIDVQDRATNYREFAQSVKRRGSTSLSRKSQKGTGVQKTHLDETFSDGSPKRPQTDLQIFDMKNHDSSIPDNHSPQSTTLTNATTFDGTVDMASENALLKEEVAELRMALQNIEHSKANGKNVKSNEDPNKECHCSFM